MPEILHIIPAAGKASRIGGIPKFLLPIGQENFLIKFHANEILDNHKNIKKIIAVSNEYYQVVKRLNLNAEVMQVETNTMNETIDEVLKQYSSYKDYLVTMPDTFYEDKKVFERLVSNYFKSKSQASLVLWEMQKYQKGKLGQVDVASNKVIDVEDKNENCTYKKVWGAILWNKTLNQLINVKDSHIGYILKPALLNEVNISYEIADNVYYDCGTFSEYQTLISSQKNN